MDGWMGCYVDVRCQSQEALQTFDERLDSLTRVEHERDLVVGARDLYLRETHCNSRGERERPSAAIATNPIDCSSRSVLADRWTFRLRMSRTLICTACTPRYPIESIESIYRIESKE